MTVTGRVRRSPVPEQCWTCLEQVVERSEREEDRLGERGIWLDRVEQHVNRRRSAYRERQLSQPLRRLRADRDGADERARLRVGEDPEEAVALRLLVRREPRRVAERPPRRDVAVAVRPPHRRHLGIGEDAGRDRAIFGLRLATTHVGGRDACLVLADVREQRNAGDVEMTRRRQHYLLLHSQLR